MLSFVSAKPVVDAESELVEYIRGFVYDKNGQCLKSEIIISILFNLKGLGITWSENDFQVSGRDGSYSALISNVQKKMAEFEKGDKYNGTGLSIETSKMTDRVIYKYNEVIPTTNNLIDI